MVSSAEHGIRVRSYHLPCHKNGVLGDAKTCQIVRSRKRKKPAITRASGVLHATCCRSMPDAGSFPLDRARRLRCHIIDNAIDAAYLVDNAGGRIAKEVHIIVVEVCRHAIDRSHGA